MQKNWLLVAQNKREWKQMQEAYVYNWMSTGWRRREEDKFPQKDIQIAGK